MIQILIVDDEAPARQRIKTLLSENFNLPNCVEASNSNEALDQIKNYKPQLIFLDIQMPGLTGLELAELINTTKIPIVFTTAHSEYALQAFEKYTIDYLLKPIRTEHLARALDKFWRSSDEAKIKIKTNGNETYLRFQEILFLEALDSYVNFVTETKEYLVTDTLENVEKSLNAFGFKRCHRSFIVNPKHISELVRIGDRQFEIKFKNNQIKNIKIGRSYLDKFK